MVVCVVVVGAVCVCVCIHGRCMCVCVCVLNSLRVPRSAIVCLYVCGIVVYRLMLVLRCASKAALQTQTEFVFIKV